MKNPLQKRLPRELKKDFGKFLAIFLFLTATIGFISGFLVTDKSMKIAYDNSFEKYNIENGHFILNSEASNDLINNIEDKDVVLHKNFYADLIASNEHTFRIYKIRNDVNLQCLMEGTLPQKNNEIAIDRLYAENNEIAIGDTIMVNKNNHIVTGTVALSDYSALFKKNTDMMFNANKFTVALVTDNAFNNINKNKISYCYSWQYNKESLSNKEKNELGNELAKAIATEAAIQNNNLTDFVKDIDNQAINFTGDDMGNDKAMMQWLMYVVMVILGFVFAVTTANTIKQEAAAIGTLRASGYTKSEMVRHYLTMPIVVTLISAVIGNILGYTVFKWIVVAMYYGSYSLPTYYTVWNAEAFILTTVIPCIIMLVVNLFVLERKLSFSPLNFLRRDLKKSHKKKVIKLKQGSFMSRFRIRVIFQNAGVYLTLLIGILFANILLMFGFTMSPLLDNYKTEVIDNMICDFQYNLKAPVETDNSNAEKYAATALETNKEDEITVFGVQDNSAYLSDVNFTDNGIYVSDGYLDKYRLKIGDTITLYEKYGDKTYDFKIIGRYTYPAVFSVFMDREQFNVMFDKDEDYFTGYFSSEKLTDIDEQYIANIITQDELTVVTDQLDDSMGRIFPLFGGFAVLLFMLMIYLLSKIVIEKNSTSISMVKILGYNNKEVRKLYVTSTAIVVVLSILASLPISYLVMKGIFIGIMQNMSGWMTFYIDPMIFVKMFVTGIVSYAIISLLQLQKISKISMEEALKNNE